MDKNEFFHQAALRICGNLEIEVAMQSLLSYMKIIMPVTRMYLQHFDPQYHAMRSIAYADEKASRKLDLLTHLSKKAGAMASAGPADTDVYLFTDPLSFPVSREMTDFHGMPPTSIIILVLRSGSDLLGYLVLISEDGNQFEQDHLDWVRMLKEPFLIAIADSLIDSELFGHEKGAFTGALSQKRGRFERANKGEPFFWMKSENCPLKPRCGC